MVKKKKYFWRCRYCRKRHRADIDRIKIAYEDVTEKAVVIPMKCSTCGKTSNVRIVGLFASGGDIILRTLKREEELSGYETYHTEQIPTIKDKDAINYLLSQPEIILDPIITPETTTLAFQVFTSETAKGPLINSRLRAVALDVSFMDFIRSKLYDLANPKARMHLVDFFDSNISWTNEFNWRPGIDLTKTPMTVPPELPSLASLNSSLWNDFREVSTIMFFWVFQTEIDGKNAVVFGIKGLTYDDSEVVYRYFHLPDDR